MTGSVFALLAAASFAASMTLTRRGIFRAGESFSAIVISIVIGVIIFSLLLLLPGHATELVTLSWQSYAFLGVAGIMQFAGGRTLAYISIRFIGANMTSSLTRISVIVAVTVAILFLHESVTIFHALGILCIVGGAVLVSLGRRVKNKLEITKSDLTRGVITALGAGILWGLSSVFVRAGIQEVNYPFVGAFISYMAALLVIAGFPLRSQGRHQLRQLDRSSLIPILLGSIFVAVAQLFRYVALDLSPVTIVMPLQSTAPLLTIFFGFVLNRRIEVFTWQVITGAVAIAVGAVLIF